MFTRGDRECRVSAALKRRLVKDLDSGEPPGGGGAAKTDADGRQKPKRDTSLARALSVTDWWMGDTRDMKEALRSSSLGSWGMTMEAVGREPASGDVSGREWNTAMSGGASCFTGLDKDVDGRPLPGSASNGMVTRKGKAAKQKTMLTTHKHTNTHRHWLA